MKGLSFMSMFPVKLAYLSKVTRRNNQATLYFTTTAEDVKTVHERNAKAALVEPVYRITTDMDQLNNILAGFGPVAANLFAGNEIEYVDLVDHLPFEYRCLKYLSKEKLACYVMINPSTFEVIQTFGAPTQLSVDLLTTLADIISGEGSFEDNKHRIQTILYALSAPDTYINTISQLLSVLDKVDIHALTTDSISEPISE